MRGEARDDEIAKTKPPCEPLNFVVQLDGSRCWGVCIMDYELAPDWGRRSNPKRPRRLRKRRSARRRDEKRAYSDEQHDNSDEEGGEAEEIEWWPVCVCLLSRLPLVSVLQGWLARFHNFLDQPQTSSLSSSRPAMLNQGFTQMLLAPHFIELAVALPQPVENKLSVAFSPRKM